MKNFFLRNIFRSLYYYRKDAVYQIIIVALLTAVITGSLLTGDSVRSSLRKSSDEKLGNTDFVISSGLRYFDPSLAVRIAERTGDEAVAILEMDGYCQNFVTGTTALNIKNFGVNRDFFLFNSGEDFSIEPGNVALNQKLASRLGVKEGDEIIVRFTTVDPIPDNAPFAPEEGTQSSKVLKVSTILRPEQSGNFSLGVSQIIPMNIFMNIEDMNGGDQESNRMNRVLTGKNSDHDISYFSAVLNDVLTLQDLGLSLRKSAKTGEVELISERIFIDSAIVGSISDRIPSASHVLTYLANNISFKEKSTPYSFVAAIESLLTKDLSTDEIIINRWVADDLGASSGDTIIMSWFVQGLSGKLTDKSMKFIIAGIVENESVYSDPALMPDFPGISGKTTCSQWDAGIPVLLDRIRDKDEDYWNIYRGTPKAFINYKAGKMLWSNNFGNATAIRFPQFMAIAEAEKALDGVLDPEKSGFSVLDIRNSSGKAAEGGTDFGSLFLSLGFFIIVSCIILLSLAVSVFLDTRKRQVETFFALGFRGRDIRNMLFVETSLLSLAGALPGVLLGYLLNILIVFALNSVWSGAVQTNTLSAGFSIMPLVYGAVISVFLTSILTFYKSSSFIKSLSRKETGELKVHSTSLNKLYMVIGFILFSGLLISATIFDQHSTPLYFAAGALLFVTMVLMARFYFIKGKVKRGVSFSGRYYFFNPAQAITPVIIIAAGIFAVIITTANRKIITEKSYLNAGGTGGYLIWAESALPVKHDLSSSEGRLEFGLDERELTDLEFMQAKRLSGDDASCLNLNHVTSPAILGLDPSELSRRVSFSFATAIGKLSGQNPWDMLDSIQGESTIFAIADQSVLEWGLKLKTGDTLIVSAEDGRPLNMIICAGLKSSVFQGHLLIDKDNFAKYFPSVAGSSVFLIDGKAELKGHYKEVLDERLSGYGFASVDAGEKLASFLEVTNTYLNVFAILGVFGLVLGVAGLGFILLRNFNQRKRELALMAATGFSQKKIRDLILRDQIRILVWGIVTGTLSGLIATVPSVLSGNEIPWAIILGMIILVAFSGLTALLISIRNVRNSVLINELRKE